MMTCMSTATTNPYTKVRLTGWDPDWSSIGVSVKALLFGQLIERAMPHVEHYKSDLFHDAMWIEHHVEGPTEFFFGVRQYGTSIGTDREAVTYSNDVLYRVELTVENRGEWFATFWGWTK